MLEREEVGEDDQRGVKKYREIQKDHMQGRANEREKKVSTMTH